MWATSVGTGREAAEQYATPHNGVDKKGVLVLPIQLSAMVIMLLLLLLQEIAATLLRCYAASKVSLYALTQVTRLL